MATENPHIFELFDPGKYIQAFELDGKDCVVTIDRVVGEMVEGEEGRKAKKPVIYLAEWPRPLVLNKTNAKVLIGLYGADYRKWPGKRFVMYPTVVKFGKDDVDAIRLRKKVPPAPSAPTGQQKAPKTLPERVAGFRAALASKTTVADVEALVQSAPAVALLADVDGETAAALTKEYKDRVLELSKPSEPSDDQEVR